MSAAIYTDLSGNTYDLSDSNVDESGMAPDSADDLVQLDDGSVYDQTTDTLFPVSGGNPFSAATGLQSQGEGLDTLPDTPDVPANGSADDFSQIVNSVLQNGMAITSVITGKPVAVNNKGQAVGAAGSKVIAPATTKKMGSGSILLIAALLLGVYVIFK